MEQEATEAIKELLPWGVGAILFVMSFLEVSKIKINPWSFIGRVIGKFINAEIVAKVDGLDAEVRKLKSTIEEKDAVDLRTRILRFGDEVIHGERHSKEHFDQILRDITAYEIYCRDHPEFENNQAKLTCQRIKDVYRRCIKMNDFL